jgi:phosphoribosyl 1,2-cyclic phosphate phosphodiesterase
MNTAGEFLFLGTGGSMGIPVIACTCAVCISPDPKNHRLRPSALLTIGSQRILIDAGPDFRTQALSIPLKNLDGIIFTHAHHDHTAGIDDLRIFSMRHGTAMPCLLSPDTARDLVQRFYYMFDKSNPYSPSMAKLVFHFMDKDRGDVLFQDLPIKYFTYQQGGMQVNGLRIGSLAYVSDIRDYPKTIFDDLAGVETLILSALRFSPSPMHFSIDEALDFAKKVGAEKTWLTHIAHELDHDKTNAYLPDNVRLAYDGLKLDFNIVTITQ